MEEAALHDPLAWVQARAEADPVRRRGSAV